MTHRLRGHPPDAPTASCSALVGIDRLAKLFPGVTVGKQRSMELGHKHFLWNKLGQWSN